jgi:hypothetical protein
MQSNDVDIENLLVIMANLPDFLRTSVSRQKVKELVKMTYEEKETVTLRAIKCLQNIPSEHSKKLLYSWFSAILKLDSTEFVTVIHLYLNILVTYHMSDNTYLDYVSDFFSTLKDDDKNRIIDNLREIICLFPFRERLLEILPNNIQKMISV